MFNRSLLLTLTIGCCLVPVSASALALEAFSGETIEAFDCSTGESLGLQEATEALAASACLAPACAKHTFTDPETGITWEYCDGACSAGRACTPTYRNPENPGEGIRRCSCKPVSGQN